MRNFLAVTKALADSNRLRILCALQRGELCVCQLIELLCLAPSTVSKHLSVLYQARLVEARKQGRWMHYRLADHQETSPVVSEALEWVNRTLSCDPAIQNDRERLNEICSMAPEVLCRPKNAN